MTNSNAGVIIAITVTVFLVVATTIFYILWKERKQEEQDITPPLKRSKPIVVWNYTNNVITVTINGRKHELSPWDSTSYPASIDTVFHFSYSGGYTSNIPNLPLTPISPKPPPKKTPVTPPTKPPVIPPTPPVIPPSPKPTPTPTPTPPVIPPTPPPVSGGSGFNYAALHQAEISGQGPIQTPFSSNMSTVFAAENVVPHKREFQVFRAETPQYEDIKYPRPLLDQATETLYYNNYTNYINSHENFIPIGDVEDAPTLNNYQTLPEINMNYVLRTLAVNNIYATPVGWLEDRDFIGNVDFMNATDNDATVEVSWKGSKAKYSFESIKPNNTIPLPLFVQNGLSLEGSTWSVDSVPREAELAMIVSSGKSSAVVTFNPVSITNDYQKATNLGIYRYSPDKRLVTTAPPTVISRNNTVYIPVTRFGSDPIIAATTANVNSALGTPLYVEIGGTYAINKDGHIVEDKDS